MLRPATRRALLAQQQAKTKGGSLPSAWFEQGTVASVAVGGGADGGDLVTVTYRGVNVPAVHCASYTPVPGHRVLLLVQTPQVVIVDRLVGTPHP